MKRLCLFSCLVLAVLMTGCATQSNDNAITNSFFSDMVLLEDGTSARASSWDRTGGNTDSIQVLPGDTLELANIDGTGCIKQIYFTIAGDHSYLRDSVLRMYWDGETEPSVEVPFGDFFGLGHERIRFFRTQMVAVNPGGNGGIGGTYGFNCYWPMPFEKGARLTLENQGKTGFGVYYHVNYDKLPSVPKNTGRFHAWWNRENPTTAVGPEPGVSLHDGKNLDGKEDYVLFEAEGKGNFAGFFLNVDNITGGWYGEGEDLIFIDNDTWPPSIHGTGSEEIFGGGACPGVEYIGDYAGYIVNIGNGKVTSYRFYVADPIRFQKRIRATVEHGHANNMANDYSSTAFWYQSEPHKPLPPLQPVEMRQPRKGNDPHDRAFQLHEELYAKLGEIVAMFRAIGAEAEYMPKVHKILLDNASATTYFTEKNWPAMLAQYEKNMKQILELEAEVKPLYEKAVADYEKKEGK